VATTVYNKGGKPAKAKPFSFSYSKLKNFKTCPRRYKAVDVDKEFKEADSEALKWGNRLHDALSQRVSMGVPLPEDMSDYEDVASRIIRSQGRILTEQKFAIKEDFSPCEWFDKQAWFRGIADVLILFPPVAIAIDYKTGKIVEDIEQLALMSQVVFSNFPDIQRIRTEFWWLADDAVTREDFSRSDMAQLWRKLMPRFDALKQAHETGVFPPNPGALCRKWCPVRTCPHYGK
jgi:hypothetical protein